MKQARSTYRRKWAAKQEYEELKEGIWLEPALALLRRKTKDEWTDEHRHVARKLVLEGGWVQKRLFDIGWSHESKCEACHKEEGTEKHRLYFCPGWDEVRRQIPETRRKCEQKATTSKKEWKWQRGIVTDPPNESQQGHFSLKKSGSLRSIKLVYASRRISRPYCCRWLSSGHGRIVVSMWLVSGAIGL